MHKTNDSGNELERNWWILARRRSWEKAASERAANAFPAGEISTIIINDDDFCAHWRKYLANIERKDAKKRKPSGRARDLAQTPLRWPQCVNWPTKKPTKPTPSGKCKWKLYNALQQHRTTTTATPNNNNSNSDCNNLEIWKPCAIS